MFSFLWFSSSDKPNCQLHLVVFSPNVPSDRPLHRWRKCLTHLHPDVPTLWQPLALFTDRSLTLHVLFTTVATWGEAFSRRQVRRELGRIGNTRRVIGTWDGFNTCSACQSSTFLVGFFYIFKYVEVASKQTKIWQYKCDTLKFQFKEWGMFGM